MNLIDGYTAARVEMGGCFFMLKPNDAMRDEAELFEFLF